MKFNIEEYKIIKFSGLFDEEFYLKNYNVNINPIIHYLLYAWKEGNNPSKFFNTEFYLSQYKDVKDSNINPLIHYILYGKNENRLTGGEVFNKFKFENDFHSSPEIPSLETDKPIDILIPVYNCLRFLKSLLYSIYKNTNLPFRILICDDASTDKNVLNFLESVEKEKNNLILIKNNNNLGFVKTVNKLMRLAENHFVILNSDTEVPPFWLERLMYPIFYMKNVASTTPFTNAGLYCSFPEFLKDNRLYRNLSLKEIDKIFQLVDFKKTFIELPSGIGFCMGMNKNVVNEIGYFDEIFERGFGEENDWCQRAIEKGYKNIHVTNLFVYHKHGGSFLKKEKNRLIDKNTEILVKRYPSFPLQIKLLIENDKLKPLREEIKNKLAMNNNEIKTVNSDL